MKLRWSERAGQDRRDTRARVALENLPDAIDLDNGITQKAERLVRHPFIGRPGRLSGTREFVVHSNYILLYDVTEDSVRILRLLHARQQWAGEE